VNANAATTRSDFLDAGSDIDLHRRLACEAGEILRDSEDVGVRFSDQLVESDLRGTNRLVRQLNPGFKYSFVFA
jgi:hypothetical protein